LIPLADKYHSPLETPSRSARRCRYGWNYDCDRTKCDKNGRLIWSAVDYFQ